MAANQRQQLTRQSRGRTGGSGDTFQRLGRGGIRRFLGQNVSITFDGCNQLAEIVGDAAGELQGDFPLLRLEQLFLQRPLRVDAAGKEKFWGPPAIDQILHGHFDFDNRAVFFAMPPQFSRWKVQAGFAGLSDEGLEIFCEANILGSQFSEFSIRISVMAKGRAVKGEELESVESENPHRLWIFVEEKAVLLFGFSELFFALLAQ